MEQPTFDAEQIARNAIEVEQLKELTSTQFGEYFEKIAKVFDKYMGFGDGNGIFEQYRRAFNDRSVESVNPRIQTQEHDQGSHYDYRLTFYPLTISLQDSIVALTIQDRYSEINIHQESLGASFNVRTNIMQISNTLPYSLFTMRSFYDSEVSASRLTSGIRLTPSRAFLNGIEADSNYLRVEYKLFSPSYLKDAEGKSVYSKYPLNVKVNNGKFRISYDLSFNADTGYCEVHKNTLWIDTIRVGDVKGALSTDGKNVIISRENEIGLNIIETEDSIGFVPAEEAKYKNYYSPGIIIPKFIRPFDLLGGNLNGGNLLQEGDYVE